MWDTNYVVAAIEDCLCCLQPSRTAYVISSLILRSQCDSEICDGRWLVREGEKESEKERRMDLETLSQPQLRFHGNQPHPRRSKKPYGHWALCAEKPKHNRGSGLVCGNSRAFAATAEHSRQCKRTFGHVRRSRKSQNLRKSQFSCLASVRTIMRRGWEVHAEANVNRHASPVLPASAETSSSTHFFVHGEST